MNLPMTQYGLSRRDWFALLATAPAAAMQRRSDVAEQKRLSAGWPAAKLAGALKPRGEWKPYPRAADRETRPNATMSYRHRRSGRSRASEPDRAWRELVDRQARDWTTR